MYIYFKFALHVMARATPITNLESIKGTTYEQNAS